MPFTDPVSSVHSGRNSRASNVSGATGASRSLRSPPPSMPQGDTLHNAGVLSMLKTSTDTGDIGALSFNNSRLPSMPRATHQRRGHASRPSQHHPSGVSSNHSYAPSQNSRISSQWDNASTQRRGSLTSMQSMPPSLPPVHVGKPSLAMMPPTPDDHRDSRSYSMTSAPPTQPLPRHRSATSLKSQGHEPRHGNRMPPGPVPPMPENRPPFVYPTRLKRPGYRSPSPALSDTYAHGPPMGAPPMPRRAPGQGHPPPPQVYAGYGPDFPGVYPQDPSLLNVRPSPRTVNTSPGHPGYAPNPYQYRQGPMRPMPPPGVPHGMPQQMMPPPQHPMQSPGQYQQRGPPYPGPQYGPPRPGYGPGPYSHVHAQPRGPPMSTVAPMAHHMFHNAARMARTLPQRTDTPMTDIGPPSSDPPSSGSAPDSSSPPTPKDHTTIQVVVDPAFINPDLVDLPDSSSEPVLPAKYFDYADGLENPIHEPDMEVPHPSVPPSGFVQRVKAMLESKAAAEAAARNDREKASRQEIAYELDVGRDQEDVSELMDLELHELAANETPRFTIIEEFEAPVELPASPVRVAELEAAENTQGQTTQRITRELVKAELGPSSVDNTMQQFLPDDTTTHLIVSMQQKHEREMPEAAELPDEPVGRFEKFHGQQSSQQQPHEMQQHDSVPDTATTVSAEGSIPTGVGYAMNFSGPVDTTVASDETQSKDPFALDADTITIQQQQAREASRTERSHEPQPSITPEPPRDLNDSDFDRTPVSPLRSDEVVNYRNSAVSPLHTETLGIDETLRLAAEDRTTEITGIDEHSEPDSSQPEDSMPPPTPRTPKTYSKSVQIQPSVTNTDSNSTGTNRFSLPGDLSTVGDTTLNSASDMVTDVAVRFSLPHTTITVGKPQIVDVSTSSTPDKPKPESALVNHKQHADLRAARRSSVTFADEVVAPLNITKKPEPLRPLQPSSETSASKGKSIIRKPSPRDESIVSSGGSRESTTDLRYSGATNTNVLGNRFGSTHLPGLKEESVEDMSISDHKRMSSNAQFPLPARIAAVKAMQERRLQESADKAKARRQARQHNRPLADTRDLPSLNFSRIDLIDRLNEALEIRPAKSMDIARRRDYTAIYCPSPQRPQSTEPFRERYTSFFSKPDEFSSFMYDGKDSDDDEQETEPEQNNEKALIPALQIQETTEVEGVEPAKRPLSPEDFLDFATQVQRLSVPTVTPLTDRLSELIPGLRNLSNLQLDSLFASANDGFELNHKGELVRPDTVLTTRTSRTSAGFRTLAERAEEIVKNGTHDSMAPFAKALGLNKDLPPLPGSASADQVSAILNSSDSKQAHLSSSASAPSELGKDPTRPMSALLRAKAPTTEEEVAQLLPKEMNPITRNARRSMILSQPSSRPWNLDENYPWSENKVEIDLCVPNKAHTRNSFAGEVLRERRTKSLDLTAPLEVTESTNGIDIGSITTSHLPSTASMTTEHLCGITPGKHSRKMSKRSIIGSISKKFGLSGRNTAVDEDTTTKSLPRSPLPRRASTHQSHKPGDRYPTSGLTPPAGFNLDEVRSFFSDNSSERDRTASFRKRLTQLKGKNKTVRMDQSRGHSFDGNTAYDAGSMAEARIGADSRANTYDGVGMSKTEFHFKRFGEKLRHLFARGGELIRSLSTRTAGSKRKQETRVVQDEWLADSLYSGV